MKKLINGIFLLIIAIICTNIAFAEQIPSNLEYENNVQKRVSDVGFKILNANKIEKRMIFVYTTDSTKDKIDKSLSKKETIIYDKTYTFVSDNNELAALLSLSIGKTIEAYKGFFTLTQVKLAPKKFELLYDKRAVDYMVKAGYNPIALITFMNKAFPQKRGVNFLKTNATSKRLANIYEYIYMNYPYYLKNNPYLYSEAYQNFLLTSIDNRILLQKKISSGSKKSLNYE